MFIKLSILKEKNKIYIIKKLIDIALIMFILLLMLLLLSMYGPTINGISLERSDLISVISNLVSGYLGLIGSFMGIAAAYWIFHKEISLEKDNKQKEKDEKRQYSLDMLCSLLSYTIIENSKYWELLGKYTLHNLFEYTEDKNEVKACLNFIKDIPCEDLYKTQSQSERNEKYTIEENELIDSYLCSLQQSANTDMKNVIDSSKFHNLEIKENIIYDKNWIDYLYYIDSEYREYVIKWITYLENNRTYDTHTINLFDEIVLCREKVLDLQISLNHRNCEKYKIINIIKSFETK